STFAAEGPVVSRVEHEVPVAASPRDAWEAWVDPARVTNFLGAEARIDLRIGGRYEIIFLPDAPEGQQGSEGCRILAYLPGEMLAFSWNAPPELAEIRLRHTWVVVTFRGPPTGPTRIRLIQAGFGEGPAWDQDFEYFRRAWGTVLRGCRDYLGAG
ncbi:MAG TPA: SRPBCC domain-containing protein, partial [Acidimicrobiia bacterium]|nr:SRPBCC domain-containing protein [Acidimicrobiia bacterium]